MSQLRVYIIALNISGKIPPVSEYHPFLAFPKNGGIGRGDCNGFAIVLPDYTWSEQHISTIAEDGRKMLGWVLSVFKDRSQLTMLTLFKSMVRSKLEYSCPLWDPSSLSDIKQLEQIQRLFTSKIYGCKNMTYWDRLKHLKLQSLQRRRERYIIIHTWKILNNITDNDVGITFQDEDNLTRTGPGPWLMFHPSLGVFLLEQSLYMRTPLL